VDNSKIDLGHLSGQLGDLLKGIDLKSIEDIKKSMDREKVIKEATELLEKLKEALPEESQNALTNLVDSLHPDEDR